MLSLSTCKHRPYECSAIIGLKNPVHTGATWNKHGKQRFQAPCCERTDSFCCHIIRWFFLYLNYASYCVTCGNGNKSIWYSSVQAISPRNTGIVLTKVLFRFIVSCIPIYWNLLCLCFFRMNHLKAFDFLQFLILARLLQALYFGSMTRYT